MGEWGGAGNSALDGSDLLLWELQRTLASPLIIFYQIGYKGGPKEAVVVSILENTGAKGLLYCPYLPRQT